MFNEELSLNTHSVKMGQQRPRGPPTPSMSTRSPAWISMTIAAVGVTFAIIVGRTSGDSDGRGPGRVADAVTVLVAVGVGVPSSVCAGDVSWPAGGFASSDGGDEGSDVAGAGDVVPDVGVDVGDSVAGGASTQRSSPLRLSCRPGSIDRPSMMGTALGSISHATVMPCPAVTSPVGPSSVMRNVRMGVGVGAGADVPSSPFPVSGSRVAVTVHA